MGSAPVAFVATMTIGSIGGWCLSLIDVPLAWMLGAMFVTAVLAASGAPLKSSMTLRHVMLAVLGVAVGSTFTPAVLEGAGAWSTSLAIMGVFALFVSVVGSQVFRAVTDWNPATRFFSAVPGGLTDMVIAGSERGGHEPTMALIHTIRIMVTVMVMPLVFAFGGFETDASVVANEPGWSEQTLNGAAWLVAAGVIGAGIGKIVRLPAFSFAGPMIASMIIHLLDFSDARPPADTVYAAQVIIGISIGCRFVGVNVRDVAQQIVIGIFYGLGLLAVGAVFALGAQEMTGMAFWTLWLAFAPGGLPEMVLMGLAVGIDPAFVTTHHLFRFLLILMIARVMFALIERFIGDPPPPPR